MDNSNYKRTLKATSLFGGVQVYSVLLSLISTKFIAVLLGPEGMGVSGLLSSTIGIITTVTALGLSTSAVRDVSAAYSTGDTALFNRKVCVFRRLVWVTGLLGMLTCLLFSPLWSNITFGNNSFVLSFAILSITLLLGQISSGQSVVMRGAGRFKDMAKSMVWGKSIGLLVSIPLYYMLGIDGIVPVMVLMSIIGLSLSYYYSKRVKTEKVVLSFHEVFSEGKQMIKMGFFIALQSFISMLTIYLIRIYIAHVGGMGEVGLYNSGFNMVDMSVGMVFAAMGAEYYPRLSSVANDDIKFSEAVNQQMTVSLLLISPIVALFLVMGPLAILLVLSSKFLPITMMIQILVLSMFLKAPGWCLGFTFLAKADTKAFWMNELFASIVQLSSFILMYKFFGLNGIAVAYFFLYVYYVIVTGIISSRRYNYRFDTSILKTYLLQFMICVGIFASIRYLFGWWGYILASLLCIFSIYKSYKELNKIIPVKEYIFKRIKH